MTLVGDAVRAFHVIHHRVHGVVADLAIAEVPQVDEYVFACLGLHHHTVGVDADDAVHGVWQEVPLHVRGWRRWQAWAGFHVGVATHSRHQHGGPGDEGDVLQVHSYPGFWVKAPLDKVISAVGIGNNSLFPGMKPSSTSAARP